MKFKYTGEAPNGSFEMYGATWTPGEVSEVADAKFIAKLMGNRFFEPVDGGDAAEPAKPKNKGGRQAKAKPAEVEPDTFDEGDGSE